MGTDDRSKIFGTAIADFGIVSVEDFSQVIVETFLLNCGLNHMTFRWVYFATHFRLGFV